MKIRELFLLFYDVHKENMFIINLEDGREAPSKASIIYLYKTFKLLCSLEIFVWKVKVRFMTLFLLKSGQLSHCISLSHNYLTYHNSAFNIFTSYFQNQGWILKFL